MAATAEKNRFIVLNDPPIRTFYSLRACHFERTSRNHLEQGTLILHLRRFRL